jgi:hypothetical protein
MSDCKSNERIWANCCAVGAADTWYQSQNKHWVRQIFIDGRGREIDAYAHTNFCHNCGSKLTPPPDIEKEICDLIDLFCDIIDRRLAARSRIKETE